MINNDFFTSNWNTYFPKVLPIPVPNNCDDGKIIPLNDADESLRNVLNSKTLRVGIHEAIFGGSYLFYNSNETDSNSNATSTKISTTDTNQSGVDGYEPTNIRELTRLLGVAYQMEIEAEIIIIKGEGFFDDLKAAIDNNEVDVVWSVVTITEERSKQVDYVCNTHMSEYVIGASAKVGSELPDPTGPPIPLRCFAVSCTFTNIPSPFYLKPFNAESSVLLNKSDEFEYELQTFEDLWNFIRQDCPNCTQVDMSDSIAKDYRGPFTKQYVQMSNQTTTSTSSSRSTTVKTLLLFSSIMFSVISQTLLALV